MLHNAWHLTQFRCQGIRVLNFPEAAVENVIVLVREVGLTIGIRAQAYLRPQRPDPFCHQRLRFRTVRGDVQFHRILDVDQPGIGVQEADLSKFSLDLRFQRLAGNETALRPALTKRSRLALNS